jgi:hypothetical protein
MGGILLLCLLLNSGREIMPYIYIGVRTFPLLRSRHDIPSHFLGGKLMDIIRNLQICYIFASECFTFGYSVDFLLQSGMSSTIATRFFITVFGGDRKIYIYIKNSCVPIMFPMMYLRFPMVSM